MSYRQLSKLAETYGLIDKISPAQIESIKKTVIEHPDVVLQLLEAFLELIANEEVFKESGSLAIVAHKINETGPDDSDSDTPSGEVIFTSNETDVDTDVLAHFLAEDCGNPSCPIHSRKKEDLN